ncbi:MAG: hypothetical protein UR28_C0011G0006 [Candidatus Peregrinibacteria bacterium GW2011_GWF2_33_10]|nr:MAG: hypothetical protein UR28_C0011G0006 [Candidatus Peregrinibacteria bacterium GW2011_GWF2_33_10]OGJ44283.1 MAG: hypothetical protein A2272_05480 [Candidatus Peregrinibacteria bacterium RIFOXYA12_FULL_33_12]OGJ44658.1 MAG: hypothetical protein A2263_00920 [Candidatus Peregrinibacteria bacterium RIFOXYA2_FULL_33_21]OGJ50392.1 MAG: hypothetical protein A2307_05980 [Candidatus Peregrinibacteria bacterium RIFOXYB2_FULL_33_20]
MIIQNKQIDFLKTITWFDVFNYPLQQNEIKTNFDLNNNVNNIQLEKGLYCLKDRGNLIDLRGKKEIIAKKLWEKINFWKWIFQITPFIKMVAVCNTLAFNNPDENSDIDLFIVTQNNRLFISRTILTFLTSIFGLRRHGQKTEKRFCLSFWITENALNLENIQIKNNDPYLAFWCKTLKPIINKDNIYQKFLEINQRWIGENDPCPCYNYPNKYFRPKKEFSIQDKKLISKCSVLYSLFSMLNSILCHWQLARCQIKMRNLNQNASVIVSKNMLKFHNVDMREFYKNKWLDIINLYKESKT